MVVTWLGCCRQSTWSFFQLSSSDHLPEMLPVATSLCSCCWRPRLRAPAAQQAAAGYPLPRLLVPARCVEKTWGFWFSAALRQYLPGLGCAPIARHWSPTSVQPWHIEISIGYNPSQEYPSRLRIQIDG